MKVNIIGTFFGQSGYDAHTKQLALALNKLCEVSIQTNKPADWIRYVSDDELKMLTRNPDEADVNILIGLPNTAPLYWHNKNFIQFLVWEGNKVPTFWLKILVDDKIKQIWVPSQYTKQAIINTIDDYTFDLKNDIMYNMINDKIRIVPHGVNTNFFYPKPELKEKIFTFIANKGWRGGWLDRGGLAFLFKAFNGEFTKEDNVQLLVKINSVYAQIDLQKEMVGLGLIDNRAPIKIIIDNISYPILNEIYNKGHVFVSPTMAEAYNLPCIEAMACGLPVITTDFGGQSDYINDTNGWILKEGTLFEVKHDVMYEGISWKKPSIAELRKVMRYTYEHQDEIKSKGLMALEDAKNNTWDISAKIAYSNLELILK